MSQHLIIYADRVSNDTMSWALFNTVTHHCIKQGETPLDLILENSGSLENTELSLVISGFEAPLHYAEIPAKTEAQARAAAPYILEDDLASAPEALHFALGSEEANNQRPVIIIARDIMGHWVSYFQSHNIKLDGIYVDSNCMQADGAPFIYETPQNDFILSIPGILLLWVL